MKESCDEVNRLLVRTASNAWFPQRMSVISLPERNETVQEAVSASGVSLKSPRAKKTLRGSGKKQR